MNDLFFLHWIHTTVNDTEIKKIMFICFSLRFVCVLCYIWIFVCKYYDYVRIYPAICANINNYIF